MFAGFRSRWMMPFSCASFERLGDLLGDAEHLIDWNRATGNALVQALATEAGARRKGHGRILGVSEYNEATC